MPRMSEAAGNADGMWTRRHARVTAVAEQEPVAPIIRSPFHKDQYVSHYDMYVHTPDLCLLIRTLPL